MKIAVLGGTGFVGSNIVNQLAFEKHSVRILSHRRHPTDKMTGVEYVHGAITNEESLRECFAGCDALIHSVGLIVESGTNTHDKVVVYGTQKAVTVARESGIKLIVFVSALGTSEHSRSIYHKAKYAAEQIVMNSGIPFVIFRPSVIYGKGDKFVNMLASMIRYLPLVPVAGDGNYFLQPIFVEDMAKLVSKSLTTAESHNRIYTAAGPDRMSFRVLLQLLKKTIGKRRANIYIPIPVMRVIAGLAEKLISSPPVTRDQLLMLGEGNVGDIDETVRTFGVHPQKIADVLPTYLR